MMKFGISDVLRVLFPLDIARPHLGKWQRESVVYQVTALPELEGQDENFSSSFNLLPKPCKHLKALSYRGGKITKKTSFELPT